MKLYSRWQNSAGERVRIALHLKELSYEYISVNILPIARYRELNPQGLLPALELQSRVVAQSTAILEWLEEVYPDPPLLPSEPWHRAEVRSFAQLITSDLHPLNNNRVRKYLTTQMGVEAAAVRTWYRHWVAVAFDALEETLRRRPQSWPFCFGNLPGWADIHLVPQVANARRFDCDLAAYPLLGAVDARCQEVDAFRRARPDQQPDYPHIST